MHTNMPNHEPSLLMMTCGDMQPVRPTMGSWLLYGLGARIRTCPASWSMCPGKPVVGPQLWSNSFLPGIYPGHAHQQLEDRPAARHCAPDELDTSSREAQREQTGSAAGD